MVSESVGVLLCVQPLQNATLERAVEVTFSPSNAGINAISEFEGQSKSSNKIS